MLLSLPNLQQVAEDVREAIRGLCTSGSPAVERVERLLFECNPNASPEFPHQWCDFASFILGAHLCRITKAEVTLITGEKPNSPFRHLWLRHNKFNLDITCDQFQGAPAAPLVSTEMPWHDCEYPVQHQQPLASRSRCTLRFERALLGLEHALNLEERFVHHALMCMQ